MPTREAEEMAVVYARLAPPSYMTAAQAVRRLVTAVQRARSMAIEATGNEEHAARHEPWLFGEDCERLLLEMADNSDPTDLHYMSYITALGGPPGRSKERRQPGDSFTLKAALIGQGMTSQVVAPASVGD